MAEDNLQDHLNKSIYGAPQTLPEERHRYLGSLRERVFLRLTNDELPSKRALDAMKKALLAHKGDAHYRLLLNGKLSPETTAVYMSAAQEQNIDFTLVSDETAKSSPNDSGALLVSDAAINRDKITLEENAPSESSNDDKKDDNAQKGFFSRLFNR